jgi:hypothetical protein
MKSQHLLGFLLIVFVLSCKKEADIDSPGTNGGTKLTKMVVVSGSTTTTTTLGYDANGRLSNWRQVDNSAAPANDGFRIQRKADGMIEKVIFKRASFPDSASLTINSSAAKYTSADWANAYGFPETQRTAFVYENAGNIVESTITDILPNGQTDPKSRYTYTYSNGNISSMKVYRISGGTNSLFRQYDFTHDQKTNPLALGAEWILLTATDMLFAPNGSANNPTMITIKQANGTERPFTFTYTYNEQGRPIASVQKDAGGTVVATTTYTYQ